MPTDQGLRSNRDQGFLPIKQSRRQYHDNPGGVSGPSRSDLTFLVEGPLSPQEEILSGEGLARLEEASQGSDEVQIEVVKS